MPKVARMCVLEGLSGSGKTLQAHRLVERLEQEGHSAIFNTEPTKENPMPFGKIIRQIIEGRALDKEKTGICIGTILNLYVQLVPPVGASMSMRAERAFIGKLFSDIENNLRAMAERGDGENRLGELQLQTLYLIDRMFDLRYTIIPKTNKGTLVVQDRYEMSTFAFGGSRGLFIPDLWSLQLLIADDVYCVPALTVILKVDPEVAAARLRASGKPVDRFEESVESLRNIDKKYLLASEIVREKHQQIAMSSPGTWNGIVVVDANRNEDEVFEELWSLTQNAFLR